MRKYLIVLLAAFLSTSSGFTQPAPPPPRLVLMISVDQMRFDYLTRFDPLYKGGLRMLLDRGAVFTNANYRHATTETGPGHSVLLSGRHPSHSGIVGNEWYDRYLDKAINVVDDPAQSPIGGRGRPASPVNALGFTVGDVLKATSPQSRVVGVSLKDRSAILMGGLRADAAYWFENDGGNFITSTFYMDAPPAWLTAWNARRPADRFAGQQWNRLLGDVAVYDKYAGPDAVQAERDRKDITFPHVFTAKPPDEDYYTEFRRTAFSDEILLEFAIETMKQHQLGADAATDIFAVGFSGSDHVGHAYGPDSHELMDQILRLDLHLGRLFREIDTAVGLDNTVVILSADHGARPLVEVLQRRGVAARRMAPAVLEKAVNDAFARKYHGVTDLISYFATDIYLDEDVIRRHRLNRKDVEETAIAALMGTGAVERVYTHDDLRSTAPSSDPFLPLYQNAFFEPRSPHLNLLLKRDIYLSASAAGTGHGSPYDFDRHVPVAFMGRNVKPGRYAEPSGPEDIAPTLAQMLGLQFPREHDARVLSEMTSIVDRPASIVDRPSSEQK
jgi:predicted AlkP superfamily pyrophosphatase or phosphodiesterase